MASSLEALLKQIQKLQQGAPYDAGLATALQNAQYQMSDLDRSYTMGRSDVEKGYETGVRDLGIQRERNVKNTMGTFADRGTLHSGIHASAQGDVESDYQQGLTDAVERRLSGFRALDEARRESESGVQNMLVGAQQDYSRRQAEAAQAAAALKAQREAQEAENARAAAAAAQNAAMLRAIAAASGGGGGGGSGSGGGGVNRYTGSTGGSRAPGTGEILVKERGNNILMHKPGLAHAKSFDQKFNEALMAYGPAGGRAMLADIYIKQGINRKGGLTAQQRALLTPAQRRQMAARSKMMRM